MSVVVNDKVHASTLTLANAAEVGAAIIKKIAGNDISTAISGSVLTRDMIQNLFYKTLSEKLAEKSRT